MYMYIPVNRTCHNVHRMYIHCVMSYSLVCACMLVCLSVHAILRYDHVLGNDCNMALVFSFSEGLYV